jgi:phosphoenolpyruvate---glycerone phosphotransferase subunit DhaK
MAVATHVMKKFINDPADVVKESLAGLAAAHPDLVRVDFENQIVVRKDAPTGKVAIISGGGSGHEPMHGGFVGAGMLDAACPGEVFTSPVPDQMLAATKAVDGGAGVVHIVKNYTGDVMNFKLAAEMAEDEDIKVESVLTNDDVAVQDSLYTAGRRGVGVTVLAEKIAGAKAEAGGSLAEVAAIARKVNDNGRSFGVAFTSAWTPSSPTPTFEIGADEMEFGVGIHGEPGRERRQLKAADEIADDMLDAVVPDLPYNSGDRVALMINGLGGTPVSELYILYRRAHQRLADRGITVGRSYVNEYCTSLDMAGASLTLVRLDDEIEGLLNAPAEAAIRIF